MGKYVIILVLLTLFMVFSMGPDTFHNNPINNKPYPGATNEQPYRQPGITIYDDRENLVYMVDNILVNINKELDTKDRLELPDDGFSNIIKIINKPAVSPPLVGAAIDKGLMLGGGSETYIVQLRPGLKLLESFPDPRSREDKIIVDKELNRLYLYKKGQLFKSYPVATGLLPQYTPEVVFRIANKMAYPRGRDPDSQLGACWLGLCVPRERDKRIKPNDYRAPQGIKYGIHGTNEPESIGTYASGGCVRMHNRDIEEVGRMITIGTIVEIRPQRTPAK